MEAKFLPPANIDDFSKSIGKEEILKEAWHKRMSEIFSQLLESVDEQGNLDYPRFYSPLNLDAEAEKTISWSGYPLMIENWLNINDGSTKELQDQGFRSAEILKEIVTYRIYYKRNGTIVNSSNAISDYDPANGWSMYPMAGGSVQNENAFSLKERIHDEYLEWHTKKDKAGRVIEIAFTAEGPEYWETIAENDGDLLTKLYREFIDPSIVKEDLYWQNDIAGVAVIYDLDTGRYSFKGIEKIFEKGSYNPYNKWNTTLGIMHLIQRNNSLGAEVRLAADATKQYAIRPDLSHDVSRFDLVACGVPAGINRNSDPTISDEVNKLALSDLKVTIANPIGLYIGDIQVGGILDPTGSPVNLSDVLIVERGVRDGISPKILRFKIIKPDNSVRGLQDFTLNGFNLNYGGPIAKETSIVIYGQAISSTVENQSVPCSGKICRHPQKNNYIEVRAIEDNCQDIDWSKIEPSFKVAEPISNISPLSIAELKAVSIVGNTRV